jgi:hypothetical protein
MKQVEKSQTQAFVSRFADEIAFTIVESRYHQLGSFSQNEIS